jgi:pyridoxal/pyridoxine/pyridoxamine kinase
MANVSISDIVKQWKVSRPTIQKRLKSGALSGVKDDNGKWEIDSSEVVRVFGEPGNGDSNVATNIVMVEQSELTAVLKDQVNMLKDQLVETNKLNQDLVGQVAAQTRLLEYQRPKSIMEKIFGRRDGQQKAA